MTRNGTTQTRSFAYDPSTQRLTGMTLPESGTTYFTYNGDGSMATRQDSKGQVIRYSYDSLGRRTMTQRYPNGLTEDVCQRDSFYYDSNPFDSSYSQNAIGRLTATQYGLTGCQAATLFTEMYSYNAPARTTGKRLRLNRGNNNADLNANFTYNNEGQLVSSTYPNAGPSYTYGFDTMARPVTLTDSGNTQWVNSTSYGPADELTGWSVLSGQNGPYWNEIRTYNGRGQLTRHTVPGVLDMEYDYSPTQNNGQITQSYDHISNQQVNYTYDSLKRLSTAATTNTNQWGLSFTYDGFGNRTASTVTRGTGPSFNLSYDPNTNRISNPGFVYDLNGNLTGQPNAGYGYDVENRLVNYWNSDYYAYAPDSRRIWKKMPNGNEEIYFNGPNGERIGTYQPVVTNGVLSLNTLDTNLNFNGRLIGSRSNAVLNDRLNSVRQYSGNAIQYYPFGEEQTPVTTQDHEKFTGYYRDATSGLDYAHHRYYSSQWGAFLTPDPSLASVRMGDPSSWNRRRYAGNDPVNRMDPTGLDYINSGADISPGFSDGASAERDGGTGIDFELANVGGLDNLINNMENSAPYVVGPSTVTYDPNTGVTTDGPAQLYDPSTGQPVQPTFTVDTTCPPNCGSTLANIDQSADMLNRYVIAPAADALQTIATGILSAAALAELFPGLAASTAASATSEGASAPSFIGQESGPAIPVPQGATGPTLADNLRGRVFNGGQGGNGLSPNVTGVRIMEPNPQNPTGYVNYWNSSNQSVNPYTGTPVSRWSRWWHIPLGQ